MQLKNSFCNKNQQMYDKAGDNYPHELKFVSDCYMTQEMCDKAVNKCHSTIQWVPDNYKAQETCGKDVFLYLFISLIDTKVEMCDRVVFEDHISIFYCPDRYKTQRMCDETADDCLAALKFIPDWFITNKMLEKFDNLLKDFDKVLFIANQWHILAGDLDKIILDNDNNFYEDDLILLFMSDFWLGI